MPTNRRPDIDELDRVCDSLSRHGDLTISEADHNGSVRIVSSDGRSWRFTSQNRLIAETRSERSKHRTAGQYS